MNRTDWEVPKEKPRDPEKLDLEAFFAIPRSKLYPGIFAVLVVLAGAVWLFFFLADRIGGWVIPLLFAAQAAVVHTLMRSPAGRGFLLTFGKGIRPKTQFIGAVVLCILSMAIVSYFTFLH